MAAGLLAVGCSWIAGVSGDTQTVDPNGGPILREDSGMSSDGRAEGAADAHPGTDGETDAEPLDATGG